MLLGKGNLSHDCLLHHPSILYAAIQKPYSEIIMPCQSLKNKTALSPKLQHLHHTQPRAEADIPLENHAAGSSAPITVDDSETTDMPYVICSPNSNA
jgi:hypothetical protein